MKKILFFVASAIFLLAACNNNDEVLTSLNHDNPQTPNEFAISNDEAREVLTLFVNNGATTRSDGKAITVKDYKVRNVEVMTDNDKEIVPVYEYTTVNENGDEGYAIVVGDRRIQKVLAQVEVGSIADTAKIPPLKQFFESIPGVVSNDLNKYLLKESNSIATTRNMNEFYVYMIGPLIGTAWDQYSPYNSQCPYIGNTQCITGCTAIAIGQILAYYQKPTNLNWSQILQSSTITNSSSPTVINEVATLLHNIGVALYAEYGTSWTNVTNANLSLVPSVFYSYGVTHCSSLTSFSLSSVIYEIQHYRPVFIKGSSHNWVCEGWKRHNYDPSTYYDYLYMNWGYGPYNNGFFYMDSTYSFLYVNGVHYVPSYMFINIY